MAGQTVQISEIWTVILLAAHPSESTFQISEIWTVILLARHSCRNPTTELWTALDKAPSHDFHISAVL